MAEHVIWTTVKILAWTKDYLLSKGVSNARLEAEWLLCAATGLDRVGLYLNYDKPLNDNELALYRAMISRRAGREPLQHILGSQEFCGRDLEVSADVLVPRYDTEVLVAEAVSRHPDARSVLDIGTGQIMDAHCYGTTKCITPTEERASVIGEYGYAHYLDAGWKYQSLIHNPGISGLIWTQITDVENEKNGLMTYDRSQFTEDPEKVARKNAEFKKQY